MPGAYSSDELKNKNSDWLLAERGRGPKNSEDTHATVEAEMVRRGMYVPPLPEHPIRIGRYSPWKSGLLAVALMSVVFVAFSIMANKIGLLISFIVCLIGVQLIFVTLVNLAIPPNRLPADARKALGKGSNDRVTELMITAAVGDVNRMNDLLNYGAQINDQTKSGLTPLMYAAASGHGAAYRFLLGRGADPSVRSSRGLTAHQIAEEKGHLHLLNDDGVERKQEWNEGQK